MELLKEQGATFEYYDPHIPVVPPTREHAEFTGMKSVECSPENIKSFDVVLVATDHDNVDWQLLADHAKMIVDTRNVLKEFSKKHGDKTIKA